MDEHERRTPAHRSERGEEAAHLTETPAGSVKPAPPDDAARRARFIEALDHVMSKYHNVLAALAK